VTAFLLSVILPVGYLGLRKFRGGPGFNEFLRYGELKDGWPRTWQIAVFVFLARICCGGCHCCAFDELGQVRDRVVPIAYSPLR
jgi:hypothetical protein